MAYSGSLAFHNETVLLQMENNIVECGGKKAMIYTPLNVNEVTSCSRFHFTYTVVVNTDQPNHTMLYGSHIISRNPAMTTRPFILLSPYQILRHLAY